MILPGSFIVYGIRIFDVGLRALFISNRRVMIDRARQPAQFEMSYRLNSSDEMIPTSHDAPDTHTQEDKRKRKTNYRG